MQEIVKEQIIECLKRVDDPDLKKDLVTLGMVKEVDIEGATVKLNIELTTPACPLKDQIKNDIISSIKSVYADAEIDVNFTANVKSLSGKNRIAGVKNVIAVASCKGGVGKSTISANLALALAETGAKVAILDADVYGPSQPEIFGVADAKPVVIESGQMLPVRAHGIEIMSIGFFVNRKDAVIWRGPMIGKLLGQFFNDVLWQDIDYMILDLPPGTGDTQISLSQLIHIDGVVMVTTPQNLAVIDVIRGIEMFKKINVPLLGLIENFSSYSCSKCGHEQKLFTGTGGEDLSSEYGMEFYCGMPFVKGLSDSQTGSEPFFFDPEADSFKKRITDVSGRIAAQLSIVNFEEESQPKPNPAQ